KIEEVTDIEGLKILVSVELFEIGVGNCLEPVFLFGGENRRCIATKIGARHGDEMRLVVRNQLTHLGAEDVTFVHADMVEFVDSNQPIIESLDAALLKGEAEGRMRADHRIVAALKE